MLGADGLVPVEECQGRFGGTKAQKSLDQIRRIVEFLKANHPTTGRGVGYYLLGIGAIKDMDYGLTQVYYNLRDARLSDNAKRRAAKG